jgi:hypothetical protein
MKTYSTNFNSFIKNNLVRVPAKKSIHFSLFVCLIGWFSLSPRPVRAETSEDSNTLFYYPD